MKTIKRGERSSFGLYKREGDPQFVYFMLPLFPWYGRTYDMVNDQNVIGWHIRTAFIRLAVGDVTVREVEREGRGWDPL